MCFPEYTIHISLSSLSQHTVKSWYYLELMPSEMRCFSLFFSLIAYFYFRIIQGNKA